jgi:endonuclease I
MVNSLSPGVSVFSWRGCRPTLGLLVLLWLTAGALRAQVPATYYNSANTLTSATLRASLNDIITYGMTYVDFNGSSSRDAIATVNASTTDPLQSVLIYSAGATRLNSLSGIQDSNELTGGWSREHLFPQSFFSNANPMVSDLNALLPADADINSAERNDKYYDTVSGGTTDAYGNKYTSTVFEPNNADKGNAARGVFYMDVRYEAEVTDPDLYLANSGTPATGLDFMRQKSTLLAWHAADPPDAFEQLRNTRVYAIQHNTNPFIDHPEWVGIVYGTTAQTIVGGDAISVNFGNRAPAEALPNTGDLPMIMTTTTLAANQWDIGQVTVRQLGTIADGEITSVKVWLDADGDGIVNRVDPCLDTQTFTSGLATLSLATPFRLIPGKRALLVTVTLSAAATPGATVQLRLEGLAHSATGGADADPSFTPFVSNATTINSGINGTVKIAMVSTRGSDNTASKEFIALANQTGNPIDLTGWTLTRRAGSDTSNQTAIVLTGTISAHGHYLIGSSNYGSSVEGVPPDQTAGNSNGLWNGISDTTGCSIALFDDSSTKIDGFSFNGGATNPNGLHDGTPLPTGTALNSTKSVVRKRVGANSGPYIDTDDNSQDLQIAADKTPPITQTPVTISWFALE